MRLIKRGRVWHAQYYDCEGARIQRTTHCHDRKAAEQIARKWERDAADPNHAATDQATLTNALALLLADCAEKVRAGRRSDATLTF